MDWTAVEPEVSVALTDSPEGSLVRIARVQTSAEDSGRLRELGVYEGAEVTVLTQGDPVVLSIAGTRFAICRRCACLVAAALAC
ncbi:MAG: ferrous iron transport protein A [Armatimonadetes bacterium]|nr:ferrous iron transport protein A [Armatimonadota bacterium]